MKTNFLCNYKQTKNNRAVAVIPPQEMEDKMEVKIKFFKTSEALPPKSGVYLIVTQCGMMEVNYSARHQGFNLTDGSGDRSTELFPICWAHKPEIFDEMGDAQW